MEATGNEPAQVAVQWPQMGRTQTDPELEVRLDIRRKLLWVTSLRILLFLVLLAATVLVADVGPAVVGLFSETLLWVGLGNLVPAVLYFPVLYSIRSVRGLTVLAAVQVFQDCIFAAILVALTGCTASVFTFFFSITIILASVLGGRRGALFATALSVAWMIVIALIETDVIPKPQAMVLTMTPVPEHSVLYSVVTNAVAFVGVGFLASYLSEQLRKSAIQQEKYRINLEDLKQVHESVLGSLRTGIITCDLENRIVHLNRAAEKMLDVTLQAVKGRQVAGVFPDARVPLQEGKEVFEVRRLASAGDFRYIRVQVVPLLSRIGASEGRILAIDDITDLRRMEARMQEDERLATIGKMSAMVAHEIRNPLAAISASAQMLGMMISNLGAEDRQALDIVIRETERLNTWITDLLDYARMPAEEIGPVEVDRILTQVLDLIRGDPASTRVVVLAELESGLVVTGDAPALHRVFLNLCKNAVEAMPEGGTLRVTAKSEWEGRRKRIAIRISDTGTGIPPEDLMRVFDAFYTTKAHGTGLGLSTVARVIKDHKGKVWVESEVGKGTDFFVRLPMREGEA